MLLDAPLLMLIGLVIILTQLIDNYSEIATLLSQLKEFRAIIHELSLEDVIGGG
jgi:hypothetical protein